jgi:sensor histidine kinase regulating citrate/malate metabolism
VLAVLLFANIFILFLYDTIASEYENKINAMLSGQEKEYYFRQCGLMQESVEKMQSYRHDVKLHLTTLKDYVTDNNDATEYLVSLIGDLGESGLYSSTGNIALDSIINFKLGNAKDDNIQTDIALSVPSAINIEVQDIVAILGNLLDNALDAVANAQEKTINLKIEYSKGNLLIKLENTFDGLVRYEKKGEGEDKRIVTGKDDKGEHGYGLKNVKRSVDKYNGQMDISHEENTFSVAILLYLGGE